MSALDDLNPFVVLRARARNKTGHPLTQADLAQLAGVSEQYIRRQEQGLINQPSVRVNETLYELEYPGSTITNEVINGTADIILMTDVDLPTGSKNQWTIDRWYYYWVAARRATLKKQFEHKDFSHERNVAQLVDRVTRSAGLMPSVYAFCRLLAIHPYAVQSALNDNSVGGHLKDALKEAGIKWPNPSLN